MNRKWSFTWESTKVFRGFLSCPAKPLFEREAKSKATDKKVINFSYSHANKTHFDKNGLHLASF